MWRFIAIANIWKMASHNGFTIGRKTIGKQAQAIKNQDLWIALDQAIQTHNIDWQWVKGHSGHRENEICDELAKQGAENPTFEDIGYEG